MPSQTLRLSCHLLVPPFQLSPQHGAHCRSYVFGSGRCGCCLHLHGASSVDVSAQRFYVTVFVSQVTVGIRETDGQQGLGFDPSAIVPQGAYGAVEIPSFHQANEDLYSWRYHRVHLPAPKLHKEWDKRSTYRYPVDF